MPNYFTCDFSRAQPAVQRSTTIRRAGAVTLLPAGTKLPPRALKMLHDRVLERCAGGDVTGADRRIAGLAELSVGPCRHRFPASKKSCLASLSPKSIRRWMAELWSGTAKSRTRLYLWHSHEFGEDVGAFAGSHAGKSVRQLHRVPGALVMAVRHALRPTLH